MAEFFAITNRGLEPICAKEIAAVPGVSLPKISYRRVSASVADLKPLLTLRTVDDVFLHLATWKDIDNKRSSLARIIELCSHLDLHQAIKEINQIRKINKSPTFSVTANFVGKRNYTTDEIKLAADEGIRRQYNQWIYSIEDHRSDLNFRVFIEHDQAHVGLRIGSSPLNKRQYKIAHISGSLTPPVAAALISLSDTKPNSLLLDPFCGAGTILIEAKIMGYLTIGGDNNPLAISTASQNISASNTPIFINYWDTQYLPLKKHSIDTIVTNLPWGKQVEIGPSPALFIKRVCEELERVIKPDGVLVLLTIAPDLVHFNNLALSQKFEISLFGQKPNILLFTS